MFVACILFAIEADLLHIGFIKRVLRLPMATDTIMALAESGRLPLHAKMAEAQARFWTRLHSLQDHSRILHLAFVEHRELVQNNKKCWGTHSLGCLRNIIDIPDISVPLPSAITVRANAQWKLDQALTDSINTGLSDYRDLYTHPTNPSHAISTCRPWAETHLRSMVLEWRMPTQRWSTYLWCHS